MITSLESRDFLHTSEKFDFSEKRDEIVTAGGVGGIEGRSVFLGLFKIGYIYKVFSFDAKD